MNYIRKFRHNRSGRIVVAEHYVPGKHVPDGVSPTGLIVSKNVYNVLAFSRPAIYYNLEVAYGERLSIRPNWWLWYLEDQPDRVIIRVVPPGGQSFPWFTEISE